MQTIDNLWWVWLIGVGVCYGYALYNQLSRMQDIASADFDQVFDSFSMSKLGPMVVAGLLGSGFGVLLLISIVLNIIAWAG